MKLIEDWWTVVKGAWSFRLTLLALVLQGLDVAMPYFAPHDASWRFGLLTMSVTALAALSRLIKQPKLRRARAVKHTQPEPQFYVDTQPLS